MPYYYEVNHRHPMSYTHSTYCASCEVSENFDLKEYLTSLSDFIGNHFDDLGSELQSSLHDFTQDEVIAEFENYVRISGGKLLVEFDSEEKNYDITVWDYLCDNIREDVMTSPFMLMNYATNDSRSGMESGTSYYMKDGRFIGSDEISAIVEQHIKSL